MKGYKFGQHLADAMAGCILSAGRPAIGWMFVTKLPVISIYNDHPVVRQNRLRYIIIITYTGIILNIFIDMIADQKGYFLSRKKRAKRRAETLCMSHSFNQNLNFRNKFPR